MNISNFLWIIGFIIVVSAAIAGVSAAPWLPTRKKELTQLLEALHKHPPKRIIDLGCGDGRILFAIARAFPNTICHGAEISALPLIAAVVRKYLRPRLYKNVHIFPKSLYAINLNSYDAVITFLLSGAYERLEKKWKEELAPNTRLYIQAWPLANVAEMEQIKTEGILPLYIYRAEDLRK